MDLKFQPSHDLRESLSAIKMISDNAIWNVRDDGVHIIAQDASVSGNILLPKDFFMEYVVGKDAFKFKVSKLLGFIQSDTLHNMKQFEMDLDPAFIEQPERVYDAFARVEVTNLLRPVKGDSFISIKDRLKVNSENCHALKVSAPGGFFSKQERKARFSGEYLKKIISHVSRYCTVYIGMDEPLKIEYEVLGIRLYFTLMPMLPA